MALLSQLLLHTGAHGLGHLQPQLQQRRSQKHDDEARVVRSPADPRQSFKLLCILYEVRRSVILPRTGAAFRMSEGLAVA